MQNNVAWRPDRGYNLSNLSTGWACLASLIDQRKANESRGICLTDTEASMVQIIPIQEAHGTDYYVYAGEKLVRVCPSIGMAREVAAGL